jgi:hypothetical protein
MNARILVAGQALAALLVPDDLRTPSRASANTAGHARPGTPVR